MGTPNGERRGEVAELKGMLRSPTVTPDKLKTVVEKVIAYMTLGLDVSGLFPDMIMATHTPDLVQKKMVYLYLGHYASANTELALLAINTLQKESADQDPMVRGLALRSLSSLQVPGLAEYLLAPLRAGLTDPSDYVRRAAVLAAAKLHAMDPSAVHHHSDLVPVLYDCLRDPSPDVLVNALYALDEILAEEGGVVVNKKLLFHLVNQLHRLHEWGQCLVLRLLAEYAPESPEEMYELMNLLEDRLRHANSAVVLATTKVFLRFTAGTALEADVFARLRQPLLTMMHSETEEIAFAVLCHVRALVRRAPEVFQGHARQFFVRAHDSAGVRHLKLEVLVDLATSASASEILAELAEYASGPHAVPAVRALGALGLRVPGAVLGAVEHLLSLLDLADEQVTTETCIVVKDLLRKYPDLYTDVLPELYTGFRAVQSDEGRVAVLWMLGEFGDVLVDAPYILEDLVEGQTGDPAPRVALETLAAAMKLFFKRPAEMHGMLGALLASTIDGVQPVHVKDRALLYYRLLRHDVHEAARVVNCPKAPVDAFLDARADALHHQLFEEFNSLAIVYGRPSDTFVNMPIALEDEEEPEQEPEELETNLLYAEEDPLVEEDDAPHPGLGFAPPSPPSGGLFPASLDRRVNSVALSSSPVCDPATFQSKWGALPVVGTLEVELTPASASLATVEAVLEGLGFAVIASGAVAGQHKLYVFAQTSEGAHVFAQICFDETRALDAVFKGDAPQDQVQRVAQAVAEALYPLTTAAV